MKKIYKILAVSLIILAGWNTNVLAQFYTFSYTGGVQSWTVPPGILNISVAAQGATGGTNSDPVSHADLGGSGGCATATFAVTPGQVISVYVGGVGANGAAGGVGGAGGFNGGGNGSGETVSVPNYSGGGGGGASDIRFGATRMLIAAGGGGAGLLCGGGNDNGGNGGGTSGSNGAAGCPPLPVTTAAGGGTPTTGGIGGICLSCLGVGGSTGLAYTGGNAGTGSPGGGGGAGLWGGGGGQYDGGGGGSSYADISAISPIFSTGCNSGGNGIVNITAICTPGTVTATPSVICAGSTLTVSDAVIGGTWSSGNTAIATVDPSSGVVTGISGGTAIITYNIGPCFAMTTVSINALPSIIPSFAICKGLSVVLTDSITGGTWTSSNTAKATVDMTLGTVTGVAPGTANITYTAPSTGCFTVTTVSVNPLPATITGADSVCQGATTALSDVAGGGTWVSSNTTIATVGSSGVVSGLLSTGALDTITYTLATGCLITTTVMVNPLPAPVTGPDTVCTGGSIALSDVSGGGKWTSGSGGVAAVGATSGIVVGLGAGTSNICFNLTFGGCSACMTVTVDPSPTGIIGPYRVCATNNTTLSDATSGGLWTSGNTTVATIDPVTGIVTGGIAAGTTTMTYTLTTGGCMTTHSFTVDPLPGAIVGIPIVCAGSTTSLTDPVAGTWSSSNTSIVTIGLVSGLATGVGISGGTATITFTTPLHCMSFQTLTVNPLAPVTGTSSICLGGTFMFSDAIIGGTWGSSNSSVATVGLSSGFVTGVGVGTSSICYTTGLGCVACMTVTVNPMPSIIGNSNVCLGQTDQLSDTNPGGTWTSSNTSVATVGSSSGVVTGNALGTATITYALATGCSTTLIVTVQPLPAPIIGPFAVCQGLITCLSDVTSGGTWSSSNIAIATVGSAGCVTGTLAGTATITYTLPTGCFAIATFTVNPLPGVINGKTSICLGLTTTLTDGTLGGSWSSSNTSVATVTGVSSTGTVDGMGVGTATITYALPTGCIAITAVTVNSLPVAITGTDTICGTSTTLLSDMTVGGTWSSSNTSIATVVSGSGLVTGTTGGGIVTITYTIFTTGCITTTTLLVDPLSPITGGDSVCSGSTITLSDAALGGSWTSSNISAATIGSSTGVVTGISTGTSSICYNLATGCTICITFTVNPLPLAVTGSSSVCMGQTTMLSDAIGSGTWTSSNTTIATIGGSSGIVTGIDFGSVIMTYTLSTGCYVIFPMAVKPLAPIKGTFRVCPGDSVLVTDSVTGGTWTSSNTNIATVGSSSGWVTGVLTTGGTVTITYLTGDGCTITHTFTVNPLPLAINGNTVLCVGGTSGLSDLSGGGTWSSSNTDVTITSGGIITGIAVPGAVITYTLPTGCINVIFVTVNPLPSPITGTLTVCQGGTTALTDAGGGTWTSSITTVATIGSSSGVVTGVGGGTSTITYKLLTGCTATAVVTVNPISAITGVFSACVGLTTDLTDAVLGGTWTSSNTSVATVGTSSGIVTGLSSGTSTICYTLATGCTACTTVTIVPVPDPITGTFVLCAGSSTTLSDLVGPGTWSSSNTTVATINSFGTINTIGITGGTTTITYTVGSGCYVTQTVTVNPFSAITGPTFQVCFGSSITLSDATGGGTWTSSNTNVATINSSLGVVTTGTITGTTTITYQLATGCTATQVITVNPLPAGITGPNQVCQFSTITLSDASGPGTWASLSIPTATVTIPTIGVVTGGTPPGVATIQYKNNATGCTANYVVTVNPIPTPIIGPESVCVGGTVTLSDATAGGTWLSSITTVATIGNTTGVVTSVGPVGTSTISYVLTTTGCATSITFTVNPYPAGITGPNEVCGNSSVTLSDISGPGVWTSSNTSFATVGSSSGTVSGVSSGIVNITYTLSTGCGVDYTMTILPFPSAIITPLGDTNICPHGFVALTANTGIGLIYQWYAAGVAIPGATASSYIASPLVNTSYYVNVSSGLTGCGATSIPMLVSIIPVPAVITSLGISPVLCAGSSIKLHANLGFGLTYQWLSTGTPITGATDSTYIATLAGNYSTVVTNSTGCSDTSNTITVVINPLPAGIITSTPLAICAGGDVVFTADTGIGFIYQWYKGGVAIVGATNVTDTATTAGTYKVTETNGFGCSLTSAIFTVTVNPLPPTPGVFNPIPNVFCAGGSTTLSITGLALGEAYQWYDNGVVITGANSSTLLVTSSGMYKATVTTTIGGCSAFTPVDTIVVVAKPLITVPSSANFCWGSSSELVVSVVGGTGPITYQWANGGIAIPGATNSIYYAMVSGSYSCLVSVPASCSIASSDVTVTEYPLPDPIVTYNNTTGILKTGTYFVSYQWYKGLAAIYGANTYTTPATGNASYKVGVTDTNGCQSISDVYVVTGWIPHGAAAVQNVSPTDIKIYPNPAQTMVHIESPEEVRAVITSIDGRKLIERSAAKDIDITALADGIYMIMLYDDNGLMVKTEKLVKATN